MKPPVIARALILAVAGEAWAECVAGDLEEEYLHICQTRDRAAGARWYVQQVVRSVVPLLTLRMRSGELRQATLAALLGVAVPLLLLDRLWCFVYSQIPLKDGIGRAPEFLAANVLSVCLGATLVGCTRKSRQAAAITALASGRRGGLRGVGFDGLGAGVLRSLGPAGSAGKFTDCLCAKEVRMKWVIRIVGGFLVVILLAVAVLYIVGHRTGAGRVHASADLNSSPYQVWPWLNEGDKLKQWVSWLVEVRGTEQGAGVGAKRVWVMKDENNGGMLIEIEGTCTEYAPPSRLTVQLQSGGDFDGQQAYLLTDLGNGRTRLDVDSSYHFSSSLARLMEPLITAAAERKMVGDVARLKALVEGKATASP